MKLRDLDLIRPGNWLIEVTQDDFYVKVLNIWEVEPGIYVALRVSKYEHPLQVFNFSILGLRVKNRVMERIPYLSEILEYPLPNSIGVLRWLILNVKPPCYVRITHPLLPYFLKLMRLSSFDYKEEIYESDVSSLCYRLKSKEFLDWGVFNVLDKKD